MTSLKQVFSLSKEEVRNAKPPGTVTLIGKEAPHGPLEFSFG